MWRLLLRRLAGSALTVLGVSLAAYVVLTFAPGDAAEALLGEQASAEQVEALRRELHLDAPLPERYAEYMAGALGHGDLGRSLVSGRAVADLVAERLPYTLLLAGTAVLLAALLGGAIGLVAARGGHPDLALMGGAALGLALPPYWVAMLLVLLFSLKLGWLPVVGAGAPAHMILPAVTLALPSAAAVARLLRAVARETLRADFVRTARAKGISNTRVLLRHVLPNSLVPALTVLGMQFAHLIGGAFVVETLFAWPGLGRLTVQAIFDRDAPVVMGAVLVVAPLCLGVNLAVDLLHGALDPRLRHEAL